MRDYPLQQRTIGHLLADKAERNGAKTWLLWQDAHYSYADLHEMTSRYDDAMDVFARTRERCPETEMCEAAEFEIAECLIKRGRVKDSIRAYEAFAAKYPNSSRAKIASKAAQLIN